MYVAMYVDYLHLNFDVFIVFVSCVVGAMHNKAKEILKVFQVLIIIIYALIHCACNNKAPGLPSPNRSGDEVTAMFVAVGPQNEECVYSRW